MSIDKYKIVIDTNFTFDNLDYRLSEIFTREFLDLKEFIDKHDIKNTIVCIPELVLKERVAQRKIQVQEISSRLRHNSLKLKGFDVKEYKEIKEEKIKSTIEANTEKFIKDNKIEKIPLSKIGIEKAIERSLEKTPPFSSGDRGFKDTLIWLSILENTKKEKDTYYILLTKNVKDFKPDPLQLEFKDEAKKNNKLKICSSLSKLKEFLDSELSLKLDLKRINEEEKEEVQEKALVHIGEILFALNGQKYYYNEFGDYTKVTTPSLRSIPITSFKIKEHSQPQFTEVNKLDTETFGLDIEIQLVAKLEKKPSDRIEVPRFITFEASYSTHDPEEKEKNIDIETKIGFVYNKTSDTIKIISVNFLDPRISSGSDSLFLNHF